MAVWRREHSAAASNVAEYIGNPLNALLLIKRTTVDYDLVVKRLERETTAFNDNIKELKPSERDLSGAVEGLLRLQPFYKQRSSELAMGFIDGVKTRRELSAHDLFVIGVEASKLSNQAFFAKEYFLLALRAIQVGEQLDGDVDEREVLLQLIELHKKGFDYEKAISTARMFLKRFPGSDEGNEILEDLVRLEKGNEKPNVPVSNPFKYQFKAGRKYSEAREFCLYGQVCRGETTKTPKELAELHCRYVSRSFFSKIAPFKVEEANLDPYLLIYHEVLYDTEIEILKNISKPRIYRGEFHHSDDGSIVSNHVRVAKIAWFTDNRHEVAARISRRVGVR